ncbi:MAG: M56 family metallopeptidase [Saprospiraceae bacterium]|nr:M56 family metallopeptidase [Saprospiraceae bacterium]
MTIFLLKLTLCWGFFALLYALLLRHETFFRANRAYLLGTAILGILLATLPGEQMPVPEMDGGMIALPEFTVGIQQVEAATSTWQDLDLLWIIYWAGFSLMTARVLWGLFRIMQMAVRGQSERLPDGCLLIQTAEAKVPFSFFRWVFVPALPQLPESLIPIKSGSGSSVENERALMLAHERAHAQGWHSADVLLAEILCIVFWFHPVAHWYRRALRTVHEYLADAAASRQADRKQYGLLLIGQSQSGMPIAFANHFFQSPLKQRLVMLTKKTSAPLRALKFGLVAPVAILFAMLFRQAPAIAQAVDEKHLAFVRELESNGWTEIDTVITFDPKTYTETVRFITKSSAPELDESGKLVYQYAEQQPQFPGGQEAMVKFLQDNLKYPEGARKAGAEGSTLVRFVVNYDGTISKVRAIAMSGFNVREDMLEESERVVLSMPKWIPAQHKGKKVACSLRLPINFSLANTDAKSAVVDPEFPGGMEAMGKFLSENIRYPETAKTAKAEGMAVVSFIIQEDGSLANIKQKNTDEALHPALVEEAFRVVRSMPKWKPGLKEGKVVKSELCVPIKFKL